MRCHRLLGGWRAGGGGGGASSPDWLGVLILMMAVGAHQSLQDAGTSICGIPRPSGLHVGAVAQCRPSTWSSNSHGSAAFIAGADVGRALVYRSTQRSSRKHLAIPDVDIEPIWMSCRARASRACPPWACGSLSPLLWVM